MLIYKIFHADEWADLQSNGQTPGAPIDIEDGFVHFSTAAQAAETAARHFAGVEGLVLLAVEGDTLGDDLKWEPSRGGDLFPHLYRDLRITDVQWSSPLPLEDGVHVFPMNT
ncbi:MAG: DUF952 domain-containing protein [Sedimentitalea sp.]